MSINNRLKTRCLLVFIFSLIVSLDSMAQFNKYRSKSKFKPNRANTKDSIPSRLDALDEEELADIEDAEDMDDFDEEEEEEMADMDEPVSRPRVRPGSRSNRRSARSSNARTFGNRNTGSSLIKAKKDGKYVNLNPETAFGPEIVQSFDFPDTDIMELTRHMQKLTGINLILDKEIKGKVSITAPTPITVGDAWRAYLTALNMAGFSLIKSGAFYKIINSRDVRYTSTKIYTGSYTPDTENHIMKIVALKNVDASEIARNFRPFMSRYGRIIDLKQTNTIIISDTGANISRLEKLIKFLDVPGHEESLQIIKVKHSSAQEISKLLDTILKGNSGGSSSRSSRRSSSSSKSSKSNNQNISRIIAEPRTNSIIAMANAEGARQLRELIDKLDVPLVSGNSGRVHVYYLNFGDAEELSKTLSSLVSGSASSKGSSKSSRFASSNSSSDDAIFQAQVKITADKNNNALVVTASPTDWLTLKDVIGKLDIPRDQVFVEGLILEASVTKSDGFGVEYAGAYGEGSAQRAGFLKKGGDLATLMASGPTAMSGFFVGGGGPGEAKEFDFGGNTIKANNVNGLIKAIAASSNTNVLATPQILAMDNVDAEFEVGGTVPVLENITNSNGTTSQTVKSQKATMKLKITPQINKVTRFVKLKINQQIEDFVGTPNTSGGGSATSTRSAITEVMIKDKDTIAMGGLLRDKITDSINKVPLLGDIPVLGWLFKNKEKVHEKVNLIFFLTPTILSPYSQKASTNTHDVIAKRNKHLREIVDEDDIKLPFKNEVGDLQAKVKRQIQDSQDNNMGDIEDPTEEMAPEYQDILDDVAEEKEKAKK